MAKKTIFNNEEINSKYSNVKPLSSSTVRAVTPDTNLFTNKEINSKYSSIAPLLNNTANTIKENIFKTAPITSTSTSTSTSTATSTSTSTDDSSSLYDLFRNNYPTLSSDSYSSSFGGGGMIDISNILRAYEEGAEANRNVVKQTYETARNDLLTSLKRFQEQNAKDVQNQQRAYLSNQASLESAIAQADRQNRISAAARGLGGSGLQQLAQLQNLLSQGQTISNMATENESVMDKLRTLLRNTEEDTNKKLENALTTYNNALSSINSDLAMNKANIEYQAREAAENRAAAARNAAASTKAQIDAQNQQYNIQAQEDAKAFNASLSRLQKDYDNELKSATSSKAMNKARTNYETKLADLLEAYSIGSDNSIYNNAYNYLANNFSTTSAQARAEQDLKDLEKRTTLWNWIVNPGDYIDAKNELKGTPGKFRIW